VVRGVLIKNEMAIAQYAATQGFDWSRITSNSESEQRECGDAEQTKRLTLGTPSLSRGSAMT